MSGHRGELASPNIELTPGLPLTIAASVYAKAGRVHIPAPFSQPVAATLLQSLRSNTPWRLVYNEGSTHREISPAEFKQMGERAYLELLDAMCQRGRSAFQYVYRSFPLHDQFMSQRATGDPYLMQLMGYFNSSAFLTTMRRLTGDDSIDIVDGNATLYEPGHFLTRHDDAVAGKNRVAAYVLNLTPTWQTDWGGILTFHAGDGHITEGYVPVFNSLNIFKVPQLHAVSYVTPLAVGGRFSVSGWLRRAAAN